MMDDITIHALAALRRRVPSGWKASPLEKQITINEKTFREIDAIFNHAYRMAGKLDGDINERNTLDEVRQAQVRLRAAWYLGRELGRRRERLVPDCLYAND